MSRLNCDIESHNQKIAFSPFPESGFANLEFSGEPGFFYPTLYLKHPDTLLTKLACVKRIPPSKKKSTINIAYILLLFLNIIVQKLAFLSEHGKFT